ncbi:hypothetical protein ACIBBG_16320 [Micromonospora chersina]|uniref:glycine-rich domain-containing protein n=1 Tax=Micromonospora chersina TaxID=47854 RepID=UPI00379C4CA1
MPDPLWINANAGSPAYTAAELRQAMALALTYGGRAMGARGGVRPGGTQLQVSLAGSTITVQPGVACVDPGLTTPQGPYWVALPVAETPGPLAAADATNPRKDIVILRVYDNDEDSSGLRLARSEYLVGVAAASPSEPAVPAGAIRLGTIDVPASPGAPAVTDRRPFVVGSGGILPVRDQAERDALSAYAGLHVWRLDLGRVEVNDGTGGVGAWRGAAVSRQKFTAVGAATWSKPLGAKSVLVQCQGGGGAGGGATTNVAGSSNLGGGGGGGCYAEELLDAATLPASVTVTVGGGGAAVSGANGNAGATSSFGAFVSAGGGGGGPMRGTGNAPFGIDGGAGGTTGTGTLFAGSAGEGGWGDAHLGYGGAGGTSHLGGGGKGTRTLGQPGTAAGVAGNNYGGGGSGGVTAGTGAAVAGGAGAPGIVIVTTYF